MNKCLGAIALLGATAQAAESAPAAGKVHKLSAKRSSARSVKNDRARVSKHLKNLLSRAPEQHKSKLESEIQRLATDPDISSWYGSPLTLDWIVDLYFSSDDDATAYPVILDSGSSNLAIAIESCSNCEEASTDLDPTEASPEMCIEVTYGSGAWSGVEIESSYVGLSSALSVDTTYAGITYQKEFFEGGSSYVGILGMAYEGIANSYYSDCSSSSSSSSGGQGEGSTRGRREGGRGLLQGSSSSEAAVPFLYSLYSDSVVDSAAFAVAMCEDDATVTIGGVDSSTVDGDMTYLSVQQTFGEYYGYYLVYTTGVSVGDTAVTVADVNEYGGLVVDTGTTLHYLPTATVKAIETAVTSHVDDSSITSTSFYSWESCASASDLSSFPTVTYTFADSDDDDASTITVALEPAHYLLEYDDCYYWGFEESTLGIFGNIGMRDKVISFDVTNNLLGFGTGVCSNDDDATSAFAKSPKQMLADVAAQVSERSTGELLVGVASAVAVVGTVLGSAFVVLNKLVRKVATSEEEAESLLPPL